MNTPQRVFDNAALAERRADALTAPMVRPLVGLGLEPEAAGAICDASNAMVAGLLFSAMTLKEAGLPPEDIRQVLLELNGFIQQELERA